MNNSTKIKTTAYATFAVVLMMVVCCLIPAMNADAASVDDPDKIDIVKGQSWEYTPTLPSA